MRIEVTQDLIDKGERHGCTDCPVALAIMLATGDEHVEVFAGTGITRTGKRETHFTLPVEARQWIVDFDAGEPMAPFAFEMELAA